MRRLAASPLVGPLLITALGLAIYAPTLGFPFVWDDEVLLADQAVARLRDLPALFTREYFQVTSERTWRPLATLAYALLTIPFASPWILRGASLVLHLLNAWLVWRVARELLADDPLSRDAAATVAGAWFVLHPMHVETVVQVTFNEDLLVTAAVLLALIAWRRGATGWCAAAFGAGVLSKESALILPLLLLAHEMIIRRVPWRASLAGRAKAYAALLAVGGVYMLLRFGWFVNPAEAGGAYLGGAVMPSLLTMGQALARGLSLLVVPWPPRIIHLVPVTATPLSAGVALAAMGISAWLWIAWRSPAVIAFGLAWAPITLLPILNFIPFLAVPGLGERYLYTGSAGLALAVGAGWASLPARSQTRRGEPRVVLAVVILGLWGVLASSRTRVWSEPIRFYRTIVTEAPGYAVPRLGLGQAYLREGRPAEAREALGEARRPNPRDGTPAGLLGVIAFREGRAAEALAWLDEATRLSPRDPVPHFNRGLVLESLGRRPDALESLRASFRLKPRDPKTAYELGKLLVKAGAARDAIPVLEASIRRADRDRAAWEMLGLALVGADRPQEALVAYERARDLGLDSAGLYNNIGIALRAIGRVADARAAYFEALRRDPQHREPHLNLQLLDR